MITRAFKAALWAALILSNTLSVAVAQDAAAGTPVEISGEASVVIADDFERGEADLQYFIIETDKKNGKSKKETRLHFPGPPPDTFKTGKQVKVKGKSRGRDRGVEVEEVTPIGGDASAEGPTAEAPVASPVEKRILTILVDFNDATVGAGTYGTNVAEVRDRMFNEPKNVEGLLYNASLGTLTIDEDVDGDGAQDVFGPYAINANYMASNPGSCDPSTWASQASAAWVAANPTRNINDWQHRLFIVPNYFDNSNRHCTWGGVAQLGCGSWCWAFGADPDTIMHGVIIHELGHNFGFNHARTDTNNDGTPESEYGDESDMMGGRRNWMKFNAPHVEDLGWIDAVNYEVRSISPTPAPQSFDLIAMDEEAWIWPGLRALKIARSGSTQYYFSWRRQAGDYNNVTSGYADAVNVHYGYTGSTYSYFVRTLSPGETFVDESANLILTVRDPLVVNDAGSSTTVIGVDVCALDCDVIPAPSGLLAQGSTPDSIVLAWNDNSFTEDGFEIERSADGSNWTGLGSLGPNATGYTDSGLPENTTFWYRVRAFEGAVDSAWSNADDGTTLIASGVVGTRINSSNDDVEEFAADGFMWFTSAYINLGLHDAGDVQQAGLRFTGVPVPQGSTINNAYIRFIAAGSEGGNTSLRFRVEDSGDAAPYTTTSGNLSSRNYSIDNVQWSVGPWSGDSQQNSPALTSLVQQIVDRPDWTGGNAIAFKTDRLSGNGAHRTWSYDGWADSAAQLFIDFSWTPPGNSAPTSSFSWSNTDLLANFTDTSTDSDGNIVGWLWDFGDGNGSTDQNPSHTYALAGAYTVSLQVTDDDGDSDSSNQQVTVTDPVIDTTPPVVTILGDNPALVEQNTPYSDAGATATDNVDGDITAGIVTTGLPVDTSVLGDHTVSYSSTDAAGNNTTVDRTVTVTEAVPECDQSKSLVGDSWNLLALPCDPGVANTVADIFPAFAPEDEGIAWRVVVFDNMSQAFTLLQPASAMTPGKAYFVYTLAPVTVRVAGNNLPATDLPLSAAGALNRNYIGYTGSGDRNWADVVPLVGGNARSWDWVNRDCGTNPASSRCYMSKVYQVWTGSAYEPHEPDGATAGVLAPFDVAVVNVYKSDVALRLPQTLAAPEAAVAYAPGADNSNAGKSNRGKGKKDTEWHVRLVAEAGQHRDRGSHFGQWADSADGQDSRDLVEFPPLGVPYLTVLFHNPDFAPVEWGYTTDFRAVTSAPAGAWRFSVRTAGDLGPVTLKWEGNVNELGSAMLFDEQTGESVALAPGGSYTFVPGAAGEDFFRITVE